MSYGLTFGCHIENGLAVSLLVSLNCAESVEDRLNVGNHVDIRFFISALIPANIMSPKSIIRRDPNNIDEGLFWDALRLHLLAMRILAASRCPF